MSTSVLEHESEHVQEWGDILVVCLTPADKKIYVSDVPTYINHIEMYVSDVTYINHREMYVSDVTYIYHGLP